MALNFDKYNQAVSQWDQQSTQDIKSRASGYGVKHRPNSPSPTASMGRFRSRRILQDSAIVKVTKTFPRELIWTHKGAGKGRGGAKGSRWTDKYGNQKQTAPSSKGKMATGGRVAKPFINDSLSGPNGVEALATIVAEQLGDALVGTILVK